MKEITEDYVSFETAKLLKEKGFDIPCREHYYQYGELSPYPTEYNWNGEEDYYSCPTLQIVMKWLREVKNYYIQAMLDSWACGDHTGYYVLIQKTDSDFELMLQDVREQVFYETPEEAYEDAIKYCLENLI